MVRDPELHDWPTLLSAADLDLTANKKNLQALSLPSYWEVPMAAPAAGAWPVCSC